jgi:hypothetical protein
MTARDVYQCYNESFLLHQSDFILIHRCVVLLLPRDICPESSKIFKVVSYGWATACSHQPPCLLLSCCARHLFI